MNWDNLLYWMTHLGEGSWISFRKAVQELTSTDTNLVSLRNHLSELGHVDFFVAGSQRWQVRAPILGGLANQSGVAVLCGGRTPRLLSKLQHGSEENKCRFFVVPLWEGLSEIRVEGPDQAIASIARQIGIQYVPKLSEALCKSLIPILEQLDAAIERDAPVNWSVRSFDFLSLQWLDKELINTAREYSVPYGERLFFVETSHKLLALPKRESIYAAATLQKVKLADYNPLERSLSVPASTPLPEDFSRVACLTSGKISQYKDGQLIYKGLSPNIAALILFKAGQPYPRMEWNK
jgi:hypothetical protein